LSKLAIAWLITPQKRAKKQNQGRKIHLKSKNSIKSMRKIRLSFVEPKIIFSRLLKSLW